jgi:hypothetical protein
MRLTVLCTGALSAHPSPLSCLPFMSYSLCVEASSLRSPDASRPLLVHRNCCYATAAVYVFYDISWVDKITEEIRNLAAHVEAELRRISFPTWTFKHCWAPSVRKCSSVIVIVVII